MNKKESNKNTIGTPKAKMPLTEQQGKNRFLSYKFKILDDENIYSISFDGKLTEEEIKEMLSAIRNCLYENTADAIQKHLKQNNLIYSDFVSTKKPLKHTMVMEFADLLLDSETCSSLDRHIGDTDIFYAIADHQKWISEDCCHGCCYTVKRIHSKINGLYQYHIIGQTFNYDEATGDEAGYFAIRRNRDSGFLDNIALSSDEPVLPVFGCIDLITLLSSIDNIQTAQQVIEIAVK